MLLNFINKLTIFQLWLVSLIVTAAAAEIIVSSFHLLFLGGLSWEYLLTAFVASFISSGMLAAILISKKNVSVLNEYVVNSVSQGVLITDAMRCIIYANRAFEKITGYTGAELAGKSCAILQGEGSDPETIIQMRDALNAAQPFHGEILNYRKDGSMFWNQLSLSPIYNTKGKLIQFVGIQRDITERKQAEQEIIKLNAELERRVLERTYSLSSTLNSLRESEKRYRLLVDGVMDMANIMLDAHGYVKTWNAGASRLKGYTEEEIVGRHFSVFYTPDDVESGRPEEELFQARLQGHMEDECWLVRKDGSRFWAHMNITTLYNEHGEIQGFSKITHDITERRASEQKLQDSTTRIQTVLNTVADGIITINQRGIVETVNPAAERLFGYAGVEVIGQNISMLMP